MGQLISQLCKFFSASQNQKVHQEQQTSQICSINQSKIMTMDVYDDVSTQMELTLKTNWKRGELIGQGSFGRVYKCMDPFTGRILAMKQIELSLVDRECLKQFRQEIEILKQLKHKNIVSYFGYQEDDKHLSILLEYVGGGSIATMIKKFGGKLSEKTVQAYVKEILEGLCYLHEKSVIHRDIKGANILVDTKGVCKLADFGCSFIGVSTYSLKGTPNWMAPEVINEQQTGFYSDIWSLGCVILEMITGEPPWGYFQTPIQALLTISSKNSSPPIPQNISDTLKDFLQKCLQYDYHKRWKAKQLQQHPFISINSKRQSSSKTELFERRKVSDIYCVRTSTKVLQESQAEHWT